VLRRIFEHKRVEIVGGWKKLNGKLHSFSSPVMVTMIKSEWTRWAGHAPKQGREVRRG
jgi:hypothetical protein